MKRNTRFILVSSLLVAALALALVGATSVQAATVFTNKIAVQDQSVNTGIVVIDSVTAAQNGWVVIYKTPNLNSSDIVGHAWVHEGVNMGVKVIVNMPAIGNPSTLWAAFVADNNPPSVRQQWGSGGTELPGGAAQSKPAALTAFSTTGSPAVNATSANAVTDRVSIRNQDITSGLILVDIITTNQNGWLVFYGSPDFSSSNVIGYAPVYRGTNTHVVARIDASKVKNQTVWAQLQADAGALNVFEWGNTTQLSTGETVHVFNDFPITQNGRYIRTSFSTSASSTEAQQNSTPGSQTNTTARTQKGANQISVTNQSLSTGIIVVNSVTAAQNGWLVIYRNPGFSSSDIVGYAPVYQGTNYGVKVAIDTTKLTNEPPMLWAALLADQGVPNAFEFQNRGHALGVLAHLPVMSNTIVGFATSGSSASK
jgi:hypothetical protein